MHHIVVIYTDAGGGHRAAAETIRDLLEKEGGYRVTLVNPYQEIHPQLDVYARWTRFDGEQIYNEIILGKGRNGFFCLIYYAIVLASIYLQAPIGRRAFRDYFARVRPDLVISVLPMLNRVIIDSTKDAEGTPNIPVAVLMTDWMELSRGSWYPRGRDYYAICGTSPGLGQLADHRRAAAVFPLSGNLIHPSFLNAAPMDRAGARTAIGLDPNCPTICFLYGGGGSWRMHELALALRHESIRLQVIFLCGKNQALAESLQTIQWPFGVIVMGFTREVHRYLAVSDLFVGKPGPGSVSEALASGLDLLLDRSMAMPQERPLLKWVEREGLGRAFSSVGEFITLLRLACAKGEDPAHPPSHSSRGNGSNRSAWELPGIVAEMLRLGPPTTK
ncbi:MAG: hypothetical protein H6974_05700 [Gammaproteobacteria bacterium]|nr:hypothetical protein [Gammaproteobacteria bacterium]